MKNELYTLPQAAEYCSVSRTTLWRWVRSGDLRASLTPGGHYRIRRGDLEFFVFDKRMYPLSGNQPETLKVLIVEDDPKVQKLLAKILATQNYDLETASEGFEAGMKLNKYRPNLIVLDLFLPGMDGFAVCKRIKENPDTSQIKIMAITGHDTPENRNRVMQAGADAYLAKPFTPKKLLSCLDDLFKRDGKRMK